MASTTLPGPYGEDPGAHLQDLRSLSTKSQAPEAPTFQDTKMSKQRNEESTPPHECTCRPCPHWTSRSTIFKMAQNPENPLIPLIFLSLL